MGANEPEMENHLDKTDERLPRGRRNVARPTMGPVVCCVRSCKYATKTLVVFIRVLLETVSIMRLTGEHQTFASRIETGGSIGVKTHFLTCSSVDKN